jgi:hypothetical protein
MHEMSSLIAYTLNPQIYMWSAELTLCAVNYSPLSDTLMQFKGEVLYRIWKLLSKRAERRVH